MTGDRPAVVLDGRRLHDRPLGGVGRSIACMLPHLASLCDVTVLTDASRPSAPAVAGVSMVPLPRRRGLPETTWLHGPARRWSRGHDHVFHGTFNAIPFGLASPAIVTIYDLTFELHPEDFATPRRRAMRRWFCVNARYAARRASAVISASRFSADLIAEHYDVPAGRIEVIPCAVDPVFDPSRRQVDGLASIVPGLERPFVVAVGGAPRRGAEVAVQAWKAVRDRGIAVDLVVTGAVDAPPEPGLHRVAGLDDAAWATLLASAEALCYPTRYEGFGLPALEAAASGTPVVTAPTASLPEVLGDAAEWCAAPVADAIADGLGRVLTDHGRAQELRERGLTRTRTWPSWAEVAARHADIYRRVG